MENSSKSKPIFESTSDSLSDAPKALDKGFFLRMREYFRPNKDQDKGQN